MVRLVFFLCLLNIAFTGFSQASRKSDVLIMFYNTENLFDYFNDPSTNDEDFLPTSKLHWSKERYQIKLNNLSKVILSGGIEPPAFIGLAEVENYKVLKDLTTQTPTSKFDYQIIHYDSPDPRGIDVAALYRKEKITILFTKTINVSFPGEPKRKTRDILYVKALVSKTDTIHFFVNHWPSRRGGRKTSEKNRNFVASLLKKNVDSIQTRNSQANIIVLGDFNDEPDDKSISITLKSLAFEQTLTNKNNLVNLSADWQKNLAFIGTHHFKGHWGILDQIMVSSALLQKSNSISCTSEDAKINDQSFLLVNDKTFGGKSTFRTYSDSKYIGGFSDHLPVLLTLKIN